MDKIGCYILFSLYINKFYTGITQEGISNRLIKHYLSAYGNHFTSIAKDWELFLFIPCSSTAQAMKIESHIKKMKSKKYIQNLAIYPEMIKKLILTYTN